MYAVSGDAEHGHELVSNLPTWMARFMYTMRSTQQLLNTTFKKEKEKRSGSFEQPCIFSCYIVGQCLKLKLPVALVCVAIIIY